jgi:hypothetical protein
MKFYGKLGAIVIALLLALPELARGEDARCPQGPSRCLSEDAERWLRGEPCGFFEFKDARELAALWAEYGDPEVAEWDDAAQKPRAKKRGPVASD